MTSNSSERPTPRELRSPAQASRSALPLAQQIVEAQRAVRFFDRYWRTRRDARNGTIVRPGLEVVSGARLPRTTGEQIVSLIEAVAAAHEDYVRALQDDGRDWIATARELLWDLRSVLEWTLDDLLDDDDRLGLQRFLADEWFVDDTPLALAVALTRTAERAESYRPMLERIANFDLDQLTRARDVAARLNAMAHDGAGSNPEARRALATRNRLLALLADRVGRVRSAARFVYRHHPEIRRELGV